MFRLFSCAQAVLMPQKDTTSSQQIKSPVVLHSALSLHCGSSSSLSSPGASPQVQPPGHQPLTKQRPPESPRTRWRCSAELAGAGPLRWQGAENTLLAAPGASLERVWERARRRTGWVMAGPGGESAGVDK